MWTIFDLSVAVLHKKRNDYGMIHRPVDRSSDDARVLPLVALHSFGSGFAGDFGVGRGRFMDG